MSAPHAAPHAHVPFTRRLTPVDIAAFNPIPPLLEHEAELGIGAREHDVLVHFDEQMKRHIDELQFQIRAGDSDLRPAARRAMAMLERERGDLAMEALQLLPASQRLHATELMRETDIQLRTALKSAGFSVYAA